MGLEVGGYHDSPDWPILGPSLLIATCIILAIRTAKWPARFDERLSHHELDQEIDYAAGLANRVLSRLVAKRKAFSLRRRCPGISRTERMRRSRLHIPTRNFFATLVAISASGFASWPI